MLSGTFAWAEPPGSEIPTVFITGEVLAAVAATRTPGLDAWRRTPRTTPAIGSRFVEKRNTPSSPIRTIFAFKRGRSKKLVRSQDRGFIWVTVAPRRYEICGSLRQTGPEKESRQIFQRFRCYRHPFLLDPVDSPPPSRDWEQC